MGPIPLIIGAFALIAFSLSGCLPATPHTGVMHSAGSVVLEKAEGEASYYSDSFEGRMTASGEIFRSDGMTAAHRQYPFGTVVRVVNLSNGRESRVRITDRGPWSNGRIIDVTQAAAGELGMLQTGVARVRIEVLRWGGE